MPRDQNVGAASIAPQLLYGISGQDLVYPWAGDRSSENCSVFV
ncbi:MAG: hypothetical protein ACPGOY_18915 [Rhodospirillaceae bacterium]